MILLENIMVKIRDSRIELLRIVLMWTVMAHHFVGYNADSVSVFSGSFTRFSTISFSIQLEELRFGRFAF